MKKLLMLFAVIIILTACESKSGKLSQKDEFLNSKTEDVEETTPTRVHLIDNGGSGWTYIRIYEVDGHEYLVNVSHGGMLHLESCPCKTK